MIEKSVSHKAVNIPPIQVFEFHAPQPGPTFLILGAVHGNEICGAVAITKLINQLQKGEVVLQNGSLLLVPIANPLAYTLGVRYHKENLNRIFRPTSKPRSDEARFANILCRLIDRCDVFLDIHSITASGLPFLYLDFPTSHNRAWSKVMPVHHAIVGWPELYKKMGLQNQSFESTSYAHKKGKDCLLIECGQHQDAAAPHVAYDAILNSLMFHRLIKGSPRRQSYKSITMKAGFFRKHKNDRLAEDWKHLDPIRKGQVLITFANGSVLKALFDGVVIMPKANAPVGDDWLYLGQTTKD